VSDFDPEAYAQQQAAGPAPAFDPEVYAAARASGQTPAPPAPSPDPSPWQHLKQAAEVAARHPLTFGVGLAENAASAVTGGAGSLADAVTLAPPGTHDWAYRPRTEAGKEYAAGAAAESANISRNYDAQFGTGPLATTLKERIPEAAAAIGTITGAAEVPKLLRGAPPGVAPSSMDTQQSLSAAAASPNVTAATPELQGAVEAARTAGPINNDALSRHIEADSLPVPIRLTAGQARQDVVRLSNEQNARKAVTAYADRFNEQNGQLKQNLQAIRDEAGPDVFTTNPVEHGDTLISAYKAKDAAAQADITAKYQALKDANGGQFPVDGTAFANAADRALGANMKRPFLPSGIQSTLQDFRDGEPMTFENFENLRTTLAAESRKAASSRDGNAAAAVNLVREQLESLPMSGEAAGGKALADQARAAAKARFDALRADPAYNAAVNETVTPDRFVQKYIIGGSRDGVALMRQNLADNPVATQTMGVAALDHLRQQAGVSPMGEGNFSQANFNKHLQAMDPKLKSLLSPKDAQTLETLGNVARYTQAQPRGSFVNNSNTTVSAATEAVKHVAEGVANAKTGGLYGVGKKVFENRALKKEAEESLKVGAGLNDH
jgi:hypothetical protein